MSSPELPFVTGLPTYTKGLIASYVAQQKYDHISRLLVNYPQNAAQFQQWLQNPDCFLQHLPSYLISIVQKNIRDKKWVTLRKLIEGTKNTDAIHEFATWASRNNYNTNEEMRNAFSDNQFFGGPPPPYFPRCENAQVGYNQPMYVPLSQSLQNVYQAPAYLNAYQKAGIPTYRHHQPMAQQNNHSRSFKLPGSVVGLIIGTGGSNISAVQQKFGVHVTYPKGKTATDKIITVQGSSEDNVLSACLAIMDKASSRTTHLTVMNDSAVMNGVRSMNAERKFDFCKVHMVYVFLKVQTMEIRAHSKQSLIDATKSLDEEFGNAPASPAKAKKKKNKAKKNKENFIRPPIPVPVQPKTQSAFAYLKDHTNILLLGVSGVGKSTFLNAIANYFAFGQDYARAQRECSVIIPSHFEKYDDQDNTYKIQLRPEGSNDDDANENHTVGASATQEPRCYSFKFNVNGKEKFIRIIDTPGLIDTEGVIKDQENINNILSYLTHFETIQAVCILTKPSEAKLNPPMRYYICELLSILHKDAASNIIFLFPHARGSNYRPGETRSTLEKLLSEVKEEYDVEIPLTKETMFCFDNDGYRYIAARKFGKLPETKEIKSSKENWDHTAKETERLIQQISNLKDYEIGKTLAIQNARKTLIALARPLADLSRKHLNFKRIIEDKRNEISRLRAEGADLTNHLYLNVDFYGKTAVVTPRVVCNACAKPMGNGMSDLKVCHNNCECVEADVIGFNPKIEMCTIFANAKGTCNECGCPFNAHQRIDYDVTSHTNKEINVVVKAGMDNKIAQENAAEEFILRLEKEEKNQDRTIQLIKDHSAAFAIFVRQNSMVACNDAFCAYVEQCIQDEEAKFGTPDENRQRRDELKAFKEQYQKQLDLYNTGKGETSHLTLENIRGKLQELLNNEEVGQYLSELKNYLEVSTTGELQYERCQQLESLFGKLTVA